MKACTMTRDGTTTPPWDLIRAFLALERHGSYEVAADMEGIDDSTLRRRIRVLEQRFGRTLFVRSEAGWKASADLHALVSAAQHMEEAARSFSQNHQEGAGVVRISLMDVFAKRFAPVFVALGEKFPRLLLNITTETHFVNLEQDQVDIAVRLARPVRNSNSLRVRKIGAVAVGAYASRAYLARHDTSASNPAFVDDHDLLAMNLQFFHQDHNFTYANLDWAKFGLTGKVRHGHEAVRLHAHLCALGHGVALLPKFVAADYPELVPYPEKLFFETELWLVSRFDLLAAWQRELADRLQEEMATWPQ
ncbi:MAG TPA: hypothetical protein DD502_27565 [Cupriavidus sp.]|nr:hypothetical protein [Cupriavidus sp.]